MYLYSIPTIPHATEQFDEQLAFGLHVVVELVELVELVEVELVEVELVEVELVEVEHSSDSKHSAAVSHSPLQKLQSISAKQLVRLL